jgi:hypothetical protein
MLRTAVRLQMNAGVRGLRRRKMSLFLSWCAVFHAFLGCRNRSGSYGGGSVGTAGSLLQHIDTTYNSAVMSSARWPSWPGDLVPLPKPVPLPQPPKPQFRES